MEHKQRRAEYAETTRAAIVGAATDRFADAGFAATSIDSIAEAARVTKGAVYHHFADKTSLFEAVFLELEDGLVDLVVAAVAGIDDARAVLVTGVQAFLTQCCDARFRRIVLEEAPAALGWARWKQLEESRFLALVVVALKGLSDDTAGDVELRARMVLAAMGEAGFSVAAARDPARAQRDAAALVLRLIDALT